MLRRIAIPSTLRPGELRLPDREAHHIRDVLRLNVGDAVELFDPDGHTAPAILTRATSAEVIVIAGAVSAPVASFQCTIASAIPKAARADWMIEKLSELGVSDFIPLSTDRSVVHPEGKNKLDRWRRIADESAKQSRRSGVMQIHELTSLQTLLASFVHLPILHLSTAPDAIPIIQTLSPPLPAVTLLVGPEGGWSPEEIAAFANANLTAVSLTTTILRIETAAIAAAAVLATYQRPFNIESPVSNHKSQIDNRK